MNTLSIRRALGLTVVALSCALGSAGTWAQPAVSETQNVLADRSEQDTQRFSQELQRVIQDVSARSEWKRVPLNSQAEQTWGTNLIFLYWDKQLTRDQLVSLGAKRFPDFRRSFELLADNINTKK